MDIGSRQRVPDIALPDVAAEEPRKKCCACCAAYSALVFGSMATAVAFPLNLFAMKGTPLRATAGGIGPGGRPRLLAERFFFQSFPFSCVVFSHHYLLSQSLWSRNERDLFAVNTSSLAINGALWLLLITLGTHTWRSLLPQYYKWIRLAVFDYNRRQRNEMNRRFPAMVGTLTHDFDRRQALWTLLLYTMLWATITVYAESILQAQYAMLYVDNASFSRHCSPRWREWRENELIRRRVEQRSQAAIVSLGEQRDPRGLMSGGRPIRGTKVE